MTGPLSSRGVEVSPHPTPRPLTNRSTARLVAALTLLRDRLTLVVDDLTFGELDPEDRRELAGALRKIAEDLETVPVVLVEPDRA